MGHVARSIQTARLAGILLGSLVLVGLVHARVEARTWRIQPGWEWGIQSTIDNAAPGDTILVSTGRYQRFWKYTFENTGEQAQVITRITKGPLTFIGDDLETTVFGPAEYTDAIDGIDTLMLILFETGGAIRFENMQFQNTRWIASVGRSPIQMRNCVIEGAVASSAILQWESNGSSFEDCVFRKQHGAIDGGLGGPGSHGMVFRRCFFEGHGIALNLANSYDVFIDDCTFISNTVAIQFYAASTGMVRSSSFDPKPGTGIHIAANDGAHVYLVNNRMESGTIRSIGADGGATITGTRNYVGWGSTKTIDVVGGVTYVSLTDGTILNGGGWSVYSRTTSASGQTSVDFENNYWGTTDANQIREWIWDGEDYEPNLLVDFEPFRTEPLPTSTTTMGSLKSRYSGQH